jgi:hypothetical protein
MSDKPPLGMRLFAGGSMRVPFASSAAYKLKAPVLSYRKMVSTDGVALAQLNCVLRVVVACYKPPAGFPSYRFRRGGNLGKRKYLEGAKKSRCSTFWLLE